MKILNFNLKNVHIFKHFLLFTLFVFKITKFLGNLIVHLKNAPTPLPIRAFVDLREIGKLGIKCNQALLFNQLLCVIFLVCVFFFINFFIIFLKRFKYIYSNVVGCSIRNKFKFLKNLYSFSLLFSGNRFLNEC